MRRDAGGTREHPEPPHGDGPARSGAGRGRGPAASTGAPRAAGDGAGPAPGPRTARDPHWDNIRFVSGALVLIGHLTEPRGDIDGLRWLYIASWAVRVPVFVILAGYFSSAGPLGRRELRQLTEGVLAPYLLIGLLHTLQTRLLDGQWKFFTSQPAWGLWFLLSLFFWRLLLPCLAQLRHPLPVAVTAALAVGYLDDFTHTFSAARTVAFLPFFLLGWELRRGVADPVLHARWSGPAAAGVLTAAAAAGWFLRHDVDPSWLGMQTPYQDMDTFEAEWAWGLRGAVLLCGMLIALSFIRMMPRRRVPLVTYLGAGGLFIYLLHPLVLRVVFHFTDFSGVGPWPEQLALVASGFALAAALASPVARRLAEPLVRPRLPWLYAPARPADEPERGRGGPSPSTPPAPARRRAGH